MPVYIDNFGAPLGRMVMCHMIADSREELLVMVDRIGVAREWIQKAGTEWEHFDICLSKRAAAVKAGAIELSPKDLVRRMVAKKEAK